MSRVVGIVASLHGIGELTLLSAGSDRSELAQFLVRVAGALPELSDAASGEASPQDSMNGSAPHPVETLGITDMSTRVIDADPPAPEVRR